MATDGGQPPTSIDSGLLEQVLDAYQRAYPGRSADPFEDPRRQDHERDIELKELYAKSLLIGLGVALLVADLIFAGYCVACVFRENVQVPVTAIECWLGATVVQVVGVVTIVTRYLFPRC